MAKTKTQKNKIIKDYIDRLEASKALFIVTPTQITPNEANMLRKKLKEIDSSFSTIKNTLFKIALEKTNIKFEDIDKEKAVVFCDSDASQAAKALYDFLKDIDKGEINAGFLNRQLLDSSQIEELAKLPSREIMVSTTVRTIVSPLSSFMNVLNANIKNLIYVLNNISEKNS